MTTSLFSFFNIGGATLDNENWTLEYEELREREEAREEYEAWLKSHE